jgi:hypothetical protein
MHLERTTASDCVARASFDLFNLFGFFPDIFDVDIVH